MWQRPRQWYSGWIQQQLLLDPDPDPVVRLLRKQWLARRQRQFMPDHHSSALLRMRKQWYPWRQWLRMQLVWMKGAGWSPLSLLFSWSSDILSIFLFVSCILLRHFPFPLLLHRAFLIYLIKCITIYYNTCFHNTPFLKLQNEITFYFYNMKCQDQKYVLPVLIFTSVS